MFHLDLSAMCLRSQRNLARATIVFTSCVVAVACDAERAGIAFAEQPLQQASSPGEPQKDKGARDGQTERKLLEELQTAIDAHVEHLEFSRLDRELAGAFRRYGLDLDVVDPKTAGARLAGHQETAEISAVLDVWTRIRHKLLKVPSWRRLADVARAADGDTWRNACAIRRSGRRLMPCRCSRRARPMRSRLNSSLPTA